MLSPVSCCRTAAQALYGDLGDRLSQVATGKRLLNANGVAVFVAHALGAVPAGEQKRDAAVPQHIGDREAQLTGKVDVENRKIERAIPRQRQGLVEASGDRRDLIAE